MGRQTSNKTQINPLNGATQINSQLSTGSAATTLNTSLTHEHNNDDEQNATTINQALFHYGADIPLGTVLLDKYKVEQILSTGTGEAVLYLCSYQGRKYVAKVYQRASAIKPGVMEALKKLDSPYVAKLYDSGTWLGMPFEIIPYYQNGSLQGRTYSFDELRNSIIPNLNEALHVLHQS